MLAKAIMSGAALAALTLPFAAVPALAQDADVTDPRSALDSHLAQFLDRPDEEGRVEVAGTSPVARSSAGVITVDPAISEVPELTLGTAGLNYLDAHDGYQIFSNAEETRSQFVRADAAGASVLSVAGDAAAVEELRLEFPQGVDQQASAPLLRGGSNAIVFDDGEMVSLRAPLIYSADGAELSASYELDGNNVNVVIDSTDLAGNGLPVVAATGFEYISNFDVDGTSATTARSAMRVPGQFNEIFPVPGAPDNFPAEGDILPLKMPYGGLGPLDFEVEMGDELLINDPGGYDSWSYIFHATENHIDGAGSTIRFEVMNQPVEGRGVKSTLMAHGVVANELPFWIPESAYILGAETMWEEFSLRLAKL